MATVATPMKKLLNDPESVVKESLAGLAAATLRLLLELLPQPLEIELRRPDHHHPGSRGLHRPHRVREARVGDDPVVVGRSMRSNKVCCHVTRLLSAP